METTPEENDRETGSAPEIVKIDAEAGIEIFKLGEMTRGIETVYLEMVLLIQGESVEEKIALNIPARETLLRPLAR